MKFFTLSWRRHATARSDYEEAFSRYERHREALRGVVLPEVLELAALRGVHDGRVVGAGWGPDREDLTLALRCGHLQMGYYDLVIHYQEARLLRGSEGRLVRLARNARRNLGDSDLAFHEVDRTEEGARAPGGEGQVTPSRSRGYAS